MVHVDAVEYSLFVECVVSFSHMVDWSIATVAGMCTSYATVIIDFSLVFLG